MQRLNAERWRVYGILEVEPDEDELEAIKSGKKEVAAGEYINWNTLKNR